MYSTHAHTHRYIYVFMYLLYLVYTCIMGMTESSIIYTRPGYIHNSVSNTRISNEHVYLPDILQTQHNRGGVFSSVCQGGPGKRYGWGDLAARGDLNPKGGPGTPLHTMSVYVTLFFILSLWSKILPFHLFWLWNFFEILTLKIFMFEFSFWIFAFASSLICSHRAAAVLVLTY